MFDQPETPKYTPGVAPQQRCEKCGLWVSDLDYHECDEQEPFDGVCPMCGETYLSFLDHMSDCDGD